MNLTKEEKQLMAKNQDEEVSKDLKKSYYEYWTKEDYLKSYTPNGYPDGKGLKTKDGQKTLRVPRWKLQIHSMQYWMPFAMVFFAVLFWFVVFLLTKNKSTSMGDIIKVKGNWNPWLCLGLSVAAFEGVWFWFVTMFKLLFYIPYRKKKLRSKSQVEIQTSNVEKMRKKYGTLSYEEILPDLGPGKHFNVTVLEDATSLHNNFGWIIKCGLTNIPGEISLAKKGLLSKRMWEERPNQLLEKYIKSWKENNEVPDKSYVFYIVSNSDESLHAYSEGDTGSGKTESFASPESIWILRHQSKPSVLFTCKGGDELSTIHQAKALNLPIQHIKLDMPGSSDSYNPLFIPWLYHRLKCQIQFTGRPTLIQNNTPYDYEQQFDIEICKKGHHQIELIPNISTKQELIDELAKFTRNTSVENIMPKWKDVSISLQDMVNVFKSWEDNNYSIVNIKQHFLFSPRIDFWTLEKKKTTHKWYLCGNWIFETLEEFNHKKDQLVSTMESEFASALESVITSMMNEDQRVSQDSFWNDQVRLFLKLFVGSYFDMIELGDFTNKQYTLSDNYLNLPALCEWLSFYGKSAQVANTLADPAYMLAIPTIKQYASNLKFSDNTFQSIQGSINAVTQYYNLKSPLLPIITKNDFNPLWIGLHQMLLVITTNNDQDAKANILLKDVAGQVMSCCNFLSTCNNNKIPTQVRIIADEAGSGAPIPWATINAVATKGRSKGIKESMYYQTNGQIATQYPKVQNAQDILFGNLKLQRCIKSSAEQSLKTWESILGKGFATVQTDVDKSSELHGATQDTPFFSAEYIRNKPNWNVLIKIKNLKTIDVTSVPLFPTDLKQQLKIEASKHKSQSFKVKTITAQNYYDNCFVPFDKLLEAIKKNVHESYNFCVQFDELVSQMSTSSEEDGENATEKMHLPFGARFAPSSTLQDFNTNESYLKALQAHQAKLSVQSGGIPVTDENTGVTSTETLSNNDQTTPPPTDDNNQEGLDLGEDEFAEKQDSDDEGDLV